MAPVQTRNLARTVIVYTYYCTNHLQQAALFDFAITVVAHENPNSKIKCPLRDRRVFELALFVFDSGGVKTIKDNIMYRVIEPCPPRLPDDIFETDDVNNDGDNCKKRRRGIYHITLSRGSFAIAIRAPELECQINSIITDHCYDSRRAHPLRPPFCAYGIAYKALMDLSCYSATVCRGTQFAERMILLSDGNTLEYVLNRFDSLCFATRPRRLQRPNAANTPRPQLKKIAWISMWMIHADSTWIIQGFLEDRTLIPRGSSMDQIQSPRDEHADQQPDVKATDQSRRQQTALIFGGQVGAEFVSVFDSLHQNGWQQCDPYEIDSQRLLAPVGQLDAMLLTNYTITDNLIGNNALPTNLIPAQKSLETSYSDLQDDFRPSYFNGKYLNKSLDESSSSQRLRCNNQNCVPTATSTPTPSIDNEDSEVAYRPEYGINLEKFSTHFSSHQKRNNEISCYSSETSVILGHGSTNVRKENTIFQLGLVKESSSCHGPSEHNQNTSIHTAPT
ncbi:unnamed protein product [Trichogramma brassicae]|uniref:Uncharacterized protein n=1 Tax=Trichogramma brassicae TaxID=86971 RepID=A0A6H5IVQ0_9HYME|nr:unnamed protein product [Trichogramma brassicae]